jgi:hypothetical protein
MGIMDWVALAEDIFKLALINMATNFPNFYDRMSNCHLSRSVFK